MGERKQADFHETKVTKTGWPGETDYLTVSKSSWHHHLFTIHSSESTISWESSPLRLNDRMNPWISGYWNYRAREPMISRVGAHAHPKC
jgi:hypothetical protein